MFILIFVISITGANTPQKIKIMNVKNPIVVDIDQEDRGLLIGVLRDSIEFGGGSILNLEYDVDGVSHVVVGSFETTKTFALGLEVEVIFSVVLSGMLLDYQVEISDFNDTYNHKTSCDKDYSLEEILETITEHLYEGDGNAEGEVDRVRDYMEAWLEEHIATKGNQVEKFLKTFGEV